VQKLLKDLSPPPRPMCYTPPVRPVMPSHGGPDASVIQRRIKLLISFAKGHALAGDAAAEALRSAEAALADLERGISESNSA